MKYYSETRIFVRRDSASVYMEDVELRTPKHEISEECFNFVINELFAGYKRLKNRDGSFSFNKTLDYNKAEEATFWIEEI